MTCTNCGHSSSDDFKFCPQCGTAVTTQQTAPTQEPVATQNTETSTTKSRKPLLLAIAVVILVIFIGIIVSVCGSSNKGFILFEADGDYFIAAGKQYKAVQIFDDKYNLAGSYGINRNASKFLVTDEDGALYYMDLNSKKEPVKLSSDYSMAVPDEDFRVFTYLKDNAIYQCNAKGNPVKGEKKIQSKVDSIEAISRDANIIYFSNMDGDLYVKVGRKDAELVCLADDFDDVYGTSADFKTIYYVTDEGTLYTKTIGKDAIKLVENVSSYYGFNADPTFYTPITDGTFYVITTEDWLSSTDDTISTEDLTAPTSSLCLIDGKTSTLVGEEFTLPLYGTGLYIAKNEDAGVLVTMDYETMEYEHYMVVGSKMALWDDDVASIYGITDDGSYVYYTDSLDEDRVGDLYRAKLSTKPGKGNLIDEDVATVYVLANGKALYFKDVDDENHGDLYLSGKLVSENVYASKNTTLYHEKSDKIAFLTDYNTEKNRGYLCVYSGKVKTVAEDTYYAAFTEDGNLCYLTDYKDGEGTLHISGKKRALAEDVSHFITSYNLFK